MAPQIADSHRIGFVCMPILAMLSSWSLVSCVLRLCFKLQQRVNYDEVRG
jgi:hypothetical protein